MTKSVSLAVLETGMELASYRTVVLDCLWGHPMACFCRRSQRFLTRIVTVGKMASKSISLESGLLRSWNLAIIDSGIGILSPQAIARYVQYDTPGMLERAAVSKLPLDVEAEPLSIVDQIWPKAAKSDRQIVVTICVLGSV